VKGQNYATLGFNLIGNRVLAFCVTASANVPYLSRPHILSDYWANRAKSDSHRYRNPLRYNFRYLWFADTFRSVAAIAYLSNRCVDVQSRFGRSFRLVW
jgi:hypothetical protein